MAKKKKLDSVPTEKLKSNKLGFSENKENRKKALTLTDTVTDHRKKMGWRWIKKTGSQKQVAPEKIEKYLTEGWILI